MNDEKKYDDPTNRVVCLFDDHSKALTAKEGLVEYGFEPSQVHLLRGDDDAEEVDTSSKWFADTHKELRKFERELEAGATVLSVPVKDCDCREQVHAILKANDARYVTHFGQWVTEVMR